MPLRKLRLSMGDLLLALALAAGCARVDRRGEMQAAEAERRDLGRPAAAAAGTAAADARAGAEAEAAPVESDLEAALTGSPSLAIVREAAARRNPDAHAALERWAEA